MSYSQFPINNPKIYVTTPKRIEHDLEGTWITLPANDLDDILNSLELKHIVGVDSYVVTDQEYIPFDVNPHESIHRLNSTIAYIINAMDRFITNKAPELTSDIEKVEAIKRNIMTYLQEQDYIYNNLDEIIERIENMTIFYTCFENKTNVLYDIGYDKIHQTLRDKDIPDEIKDYINYEQIGRDRMFGDGGTIVGYGGCIDSDLSFVIFDYNMD